MSLRSPLERLRQSVAYEAGGLVMTVPLYAFALDAEVGESLALMAAVSLVAMIVSPIHNAVFDVVEWRSVRRVASDRPARWRAVHAVSHEVTATAAVVPVLMWMGGHGFWEALAIDFVLTVIYAVWAYAFHWLWDRWRPVAKPAAPAPHPAP